MASVWSKTPVSPGSSQLEHLNEHLSNATAYDFFKHYDSNNADGYRARKRTDLTLDISWNAESEIVFYRDGIPHSDDSGLIDQGTQTDMGLCFDDKHHHLENYCLVPITAPLSPTSDYSSPTSPNTFQFPSPALPVSPTTRTKQVFDFNLNSFAADFATKTLLSDSRKKHHNTFCGFCYNNARVNGCDVTGQGRWLEHNLRDANGRVTCPCLRMFQCPICGGSGDDAHTQRHCPKRNRGRD
ncbi:unnamed protein product [Bursaphelenchus okinawaensis]|uniref:Nanos-type domain-containing protein n=1 Tax=Bursaphelenchus okinawaensis TaxID=465554 RepID=A0A811LA34_9BILA|nr:unnamed protein product [Bursaphelenchus okinawaensis]CAG9119878.1 unnamed protein product [Bursaphelenchus okinawaensis]